MASHAGGADASQQSEPIVGISQVPWRGIVSGLPLVRRKASQLCAVLREVRQADVVAREAAPPAMPHLFDRRHDRADGYARDGWFFFSEVEPRICSTGRTSRVEFRSGFHGESRGRHRINVDVKSCGGSGAAGGYARRFGRPGIFRQRDACTGTARVDIPRKPEQDFAAFRRSDAAFSFHSAHHSWAGSSA
jgi:hypothetical protein